MTSSYGPAVLRLEVQDSARETYQRLSTSGLTPAVYDFGQLIGFNWLLVEWIDGTPLDAEAAAAVTSA